MLKVELHSHTADDPHDRIPHTAEQLIDRAAALGYGALAITLHDRQLDSPRLTDYAYQRRVVLIPGIERTIAGKHVLLLNFTVEAQSVRSFADVARLKRRQPKGWWWRRTPISLRPAACGDCWTTMKMCSTRWR